MPRFLSVGSSFVLALAASAAHAQLAGPVYSWDGAPSIDDWIRSFGAASTSATLDNNTPGILTITETSATAGGSQAFSDGFNRIRESSTASGGFDATGLQFLEWDLGHNGTGPVNVQFYTQAGTGSSFVALGPDLAVAPGMATYQVPLTALLPNFKVYMRTIGINIRDHAAEGNLTWQIGEVRTVNQTLTERVLITHDTGTAEGGLQGAIVNFDNAAVQGNNGGQNQTGLSHNPAGTGSLQWTDLGGSNGAAISWGNGTAWNGNTFNNRCTDLSGWDLMTVRISATDLLAGGGQINIQAFFQTGPGFTFQSAGTLPLDIDGQFHELTFNITGINDLNVVDLTGINLGAHAQDLIMNVDSITFSRIPEPASALALATLALFRRRR